MLWISHTDRGFWPRAAPQLFLKALRSQQVPPTRHTTIVLAQRTAETQ